MSCCCPVRKHRQWRYSVSCGYPNSQPTTDNPPPTPQPKSLYRVHQNHENVVNCRMHNPRTLLQWDTFMLLSRRPPQSPFLLPQQTVRFHFTDQFIIIFLNSSLHGTQLGETLFNESSLCSYDDGFLQWSNSMGAWNDNFVGRTPEAWRHELMIGEGITKYNSDLLKTCLNFHADLDFWWLLRRMARWNLEDGWIGDDSILAWFVWRAMSNIRIDRYLVMGGQSWTNISWRTPSSKETFWKIDDLVKKRLEWLISFFEAKVFWFIS